MLVVLKNGPGRQFREIEGEQGDDFHMRLPPYQSMLLDELKSRFGAIDQRFDTLIERIKGKGTVSENSGLKTAVRFQKFQNS